MHALSMRQSEGNIPLTNVQSAYHNPYHTFPELYLDTAVLSLILHRPMQCTVYKALWTFVLPQKNAHRQKPLHHFMSHHNKINKHILQLYPSVPQCTLCASETEGSCVPSTPTEGEAEREAGVSRGMLAHSAWLAKWYFN